MAARTPQTHAKRQREIAKAEKRQKKAEKKALRKALKSNDSESAAEGAQPETAET